jgi:hypothetical protein
VKARCGLSLLLILLALASAGCAEATSDSRDAPSPAESYESAEDGIEVPDVANDDGADAVSNIEAEGLTATLVDANDDPGFDDARDATGCDVVDQDPAADHVVERDSEVTISVDCTQLDWENQEGSRWELFDEAYATGFDAGCEALFADSPNGSLYEDDVEYTATDCQNENPGAGSEASDLPTDVPDDPETVGTEVGELDGCTALFANQGVTSLNYGEASLTDLDCPLRGTAAAARPDKPDRSGGNPPKGGSGPMGSSRRRSSHGWSSCHPQSSSPTSRRRPPLPRRTSSEPRRGSRSASPRASAS